MALQQIRFQTFKNQDEELGDFNVTFLIDGKKLLANKCMLMPVSTTFASMLSARWTSNDDPIPIDTYGYDEFYQFLTFVYSEECRLTNDNIFTMLDIAEFFNVPTFKDYCIEYLQTFEWTPQNVFKLLETSIKYSIDTLTMPLVQSVRLNYCNSEEFLEVSKELLLSILEADQSKVPNDEEVFEKVYQWVENYANSKKAADANLNLEETIKTSMLEVMPFFDFEKMDRRFIENFFAEKLTLLNLPHLNGNMSKCNDAEPKVIVKITDANGRIMKGRFQDADHVYEDIQNLADKCGNYSMAFRHEHLSWQTSRKALPKQPQPMSKNDVQWNLSYNRYGKLCVVESIPCSINACFIAELVAEERFHLNGKCTIKAVRF